MSNAFAQRLRALRGSRSQVAFARELGIPAPMYHRYERGQLPQAKNLRVIADHCQVTVDSLLGRALPDAPPFDASPLSVERSALNVERSTFNAQRPPPEAPPLPAIAVAYLALVRDLVPLLAVGQDVDFIASRLTLDLAALIAWARLQIAPVPTPPSPPSNSERVRNLPDPPTAPAP